MSIVEFLEARLAEDEAMARAASHQKVAGPFHGDWRRDSFHLSSMEREDAAHIARHDPARVLAECAAKRAIIANRERIDRSANEDEWSMGYSDANYEALRSLAAVYNSHPDYREEWAK